MHIILPVSFIMTFFLFFLFCCFSFFSLYFYVMCIGRIVLVQDEGVGTLTSEVHPGLMFQVHLFESCKASLCNDEHSSLSPVTFLLSVAKLTFPSSGCACKVKDLSNFSTFCSTELHIFIPVLLSLTRLISGLVDITTERRRKKCFLV